MLYIHVRFVICLSQEKLFWGTRPGSGGQLWTSFRWIARRLNFCNRIPVFISDFTPALVNRISLMRHTCHCRSSSQSISTLIATTALGRIWEHVGLPDASSTRYCLQGYPRCVVITQGFCAFLISRYAAVRSPDKLRPGSHLCAALQADGSKTAHLHLSRYITHRVRNRPAPITAITASIFRCLLLPFNVWFRAFLYQDIHKFLREK